MLLAQVYLFLPLYPLGNVQDAINRHAVNSTRYSEKEMLQLFLGTCKAVQAMHRYRLPDVPVGGRRVSGEDDRSHEASLANGATRRGGQPGKMAKMSLPSRKGGRRGVKGDDAPLIDGAATNGESDPFGIDSDHDDDDDEEDGAAYPPKPSVKGKEREIVQPAMGGDGLEEGKGGEMVPYAHRDIKPG